MKTLFAIFGYAFVSISHSFAQIPHSIEQPSWAFPIYFEDATGARDTVYYGYDQLANQGESWPTLIDTAFGEFFEPFDTINFSAYLGENNWWNGADSVIKTVVWPSLGQVPIHLSRGVYPVTVKWDSQALYSDSLPFPDQDPLPRAEIVVWIGDLITVPDCGFTEPILLTDTSTYGVCSFSDSLILNPQFCLGCSFESSGIDLNFRAWQGYWVGIIEEKQPVIEIFPNPAANLLSISGVERMNNVQYEIYSVEGKKVLEEHLISPQIDIRKLKLGFYLLRLKHLGQTVHTFRFLKTNR